MLTCRPSCRGTPLLCAPKLPTIDGTIPDRRINNCTRIGTPVSKVFYDESIRQRFFSGEVVDYCSERGLYMVTYEDGDSEEIDIVELDMIAIYTKNKKRRANDQQLLASSGDDILKELQRKVKNETKKETLAQKLQRSMCGGHYHMSGGDDDGNVSVDEPITSTLSVRRTKNGMKKDALAQNECNFTDSNSIMKCFKYCKDKGRLQPELSEIAQLGSTEEKVQFLRNWRIMTSEQQKQHKKDKRKEASEHKKSAKAEQVRRRKQLAKELRIAIKAEKTEKKRKLKELADAQKIAITYKARQEMRSFVLDSIGIIFAKEKRKSNKIKIKKQSLKEINKSKSPKLRPKLKPKYRSNVSRRRLPATVIASNPNRINSSRRFPVSKPVKVADRHLKEAINNSYSETLPAFRPRKLVWASETNNEKAEKHPAFLVSVEEGEDGNAVIEWASTQNRVTLPKSHISWELTSRRHGCGRKRSKPLKVAAAGDKSQAQRNEMVTEVSIGNKHNKGSLRNNFLPDYQPSIQIKSEDNVVPDYQPSLQIESDDMDNNKTMRSLTEIVKKEYYDAETDSEAEETNEWIRIKNEETDDEGDVMCRG